jgi:hypothetical protein
VRYASGPTVNTLFVSTSVHDLRLLYPEDERFRHLSDEARVVVSACHSPSRLAVTTGGGRRQSPSPGSSSSAMIPSATTMSRRGSGSCAGPPTTDPSVILNHQANGPR